MWGGLKVPFSMHLCADIFAPIDDLKRKTSTLAKRIQGFQSACRDYDW